MLETIYVAISASSSVCSGITAVILCILYSDSRQRESDIDFFIPTSFYICFSNLIWCISSAFFGFSPTDGRSQKDNVKCVTQSVVNMTFIKSSILWTTVLLYTMMNYILRMKSKENRRKNAQNYNDGITQRVERYIASINRFAFHFFNWSISSFTSLLPMIVTLDPFTDIYNPIGSDENSWCFLTNQHASWVLAIFDSFLVFSILLIFMFSLYIHCNQWELLYKAPNEIFNMYLCFKLYALICLICFGPILVYLLIININQLTGTSTALHEISYYFNIFSIIMQSYGILFPIVYVIQNTKYNTKILNFICCIPNYYSGRLRNISDNNNNNNNNNNSAGNDDELFNNIHPNYAGNDNYSNNNRQVSPLTTNSIQKQNPSQRKNSNIKQNFPIIRNNDTNDNMNSYYESDEYKNQNNNNNNEKNNITASQIRLSPNSDAKRKIQDQWNKLLQDSLLEDHPTETVNKSSIINNRNTYNNNHDHNNNERINNERMNNEIINFTNEEFKDAGHRRIVKGLYGSYLSV